MQTNRQTSDIIALTYRYVGSYATYLGVKLGVFNNSNATINATRLQELLQGQNKTFQVSGIKKLLDTLCAYQLLTKDNSDQYKLTELGNELVDTKIQNNITQEFTDTRWNRVSKLTSAEFRKSDQIYNELFFQRDRSLTPRINSLLNGYQDVKMLQFACGLQLFESMRDEMQTCQQLAECVNVPAEKLGILLTHLTKIGIITAYENRYSLNACSKSLRRDNNNLSSFVLHETPEKWLALGQLINTFQTGEDAFTKANGKPLFEYLKDYPTQVQLFNEAMTAISSSIEIAAITEQISFSGVVMDMGGGEGKLLSAILNKNASATGIIFDLPEVIQKISASNRSLLRAGSFFSAQDIPPADTIILKRVLHDWDDTKAITILRNCEAKLLKDGRILIMEYLADSELMAKADLLMLAIGGQARSSKDFLRLAEDAGLAVNNITALTPMFSVIEMKRLKHANIAYEYLRRH